MRRVSEKLIDFAGLQVTRSGKKGCGSCRLQIGRQATVSVLGKNLDILEVPRLFYYFNVLFWYICCSRPLAIPRVHFKIHDFIRGVDLAQIAQRRLRKKTRKRGLRRTCSKLWALVMVVSMMVLCQECVTTADRKARENRAQDVKDRSKVRAAAIFRLS